MLLIQGTELEQIHFNLYANDIYDFINDVLAFTYNSDTTPLVVDNRFPQTGLKANNANK